jgi:hypothetical protein
MGMRVEFHRTAVRAYAVKVSRETGPAMIMDPAPGYDPQMPHDLLHLIIEMELGFTRGIFGQLAAGGTAGTFRHAERATTDRRDAARRRRHLNGKGDRLVAEGRGEAESSERLSAFCLHAWLARSTDPTLRQKAVAMSPNLPPRSGAGGGGSEAALTETLLRNVLERMDDWSAQWRRVRVGECLVVPWCPRSRRSRHRR